MTILVTGTAGFIGCAAALKLLERGDKIIGIDNLNDYYDVKLKQARLDRLKPYSNFIQIDGDISDRDIMTKLFKQHQPEKVLHLAAQAGVRYSLQNPQAYIDSNIQGFMNILEGCRYNNIQHLVYASSSSVYGANTKIPFSIHHNVDHPVSLYAATKKSNELMAHTYSHLYKIPTTGLRFFTVYGPWGRPDMSPFLFTKNILSGKPIQVFNYGKHKRDFTYIDDIVEGIIRTLDKTAQPNTQWSSNAPDSASSQAPYRIYNIGHNHPVALMDFIHLLEKFLGKKAECEYLPMQAGDVENTYADIDALIADVDYRPSTSIETGVEKFVAWYRNYYG